MRVRKNFNKKYLFDGWVSENPYYDCFAIASIAKCYPKTRIPSVKVGENNQRAKKTKTRKMNAVVPKNLSQCKGIPIPEISRHFFLVESGKRLKESGIPLTIGVRNPNSTDKKTGFQYLEFEFTAWNPESETALDSLA